MLSKKEEQCTSLSSETETLKIQLSGKISDDRVNLDRLFFFSPPLVHNFQQTGTFFLPSFSSGLEAKLKSGEEKLEQLTKDKAKLEGNISELIKSSGDSSTQLTKMNEDLTQKER